MTNCPPKLRGDLSKWLLEINTGVYVGQVSARVRDALWNRICENIGSGQATMVFTANNEQHMDFYVHNTTWKPVDLDGIKLMKHPERSAAPAVNTTEQGFSNASRQRMQQRRRRRTPVDSYVLLDLETTGLSHETDQIIEIGAVEVSAGKIMSQNDWLIHADHVPDVIEKMTGIHTQLLASEGHELKEVLETVFDMIDDKNVLVYHADFDISFLKKAAERCDLEFPDIHVLDVVELAKQRIKEVSSYKLENIARYLGIDKKQKHRALEDCLLLQDVYLKLNEI